MDSKYTTIKIKGEGSESKADDTPCIKLEQTGPDVLGLVYELAQDSIKLEEVNMEVEGVSSTSTMEYVGIEDGEEACDTTPLTDKMGIKVETDVADYVTYDMLKSTSATKLAEKFGVGRTQVSDILKNKSDLKKIFEENSNPEQKRKFPKTEGLAIDQVVYNWFYKSRNRNIPISVPLLKEKALEAAKNLKILNFKASNGWLEKFCQRHEMLVDFVQNHPELLSGKFTAKFTKKRAQQLWEEIMNKLNAIPGGSNKNWLQWRKSWRDMRKHVKAKRAMQRRHTETTGGGPVNPVTLDPVEEKILETLSPKEIFGDQDDMVSEVIFEFMEASVVIRPSVAGPLSLSAPSTTMSNGEISEMAVNIENSTTPTPVRSAGKRPLKQLKNARRLAKSHEISKRLTEIEQRKCDVVAAYYAKKTNYLSWREEIKDEPKTELWDETPTTVAVEQVKMEEQGAVAVKLEGVDTKTEDIDITELTEEVDIKPDIKIEGEEDRFRLRADLLNHIHSKICLSISYICTRCDEAFSNKSGLENHRLEKHGVSKTIPKCSNNILHNIFKCTHCDATYSRKVLRDNHIVKKHPNFASSVASKTYQCQYCNYISTRRSYYGKHVSTKHPDVTVDLGFACARCSRSYHSKQALDDHVIENHPNFLQSVTSIIYECEYCPYKSTVRRKLNTHVVSVHSPCIYCKKTFKSRWALDDHKLKKHQDFLSSFSGKIYECEYCTYKTTLKCLLQRHLWVHPGATKTGKVWTCKHCQRSFKTNQVMSEHIVQKHPEFAASVSYKIRECTNCSYKTTLKRRLDDHALKHAFALNEKYRKKGLGVGDRPAERKLFICYKCNYTARAKKIINIHISSGHCNLNTESDKSLTSPKKSDPLHKYLCPQCNKAYPRRRNLNCHIIRMHEELIAAVTCKIYRCTNCDYKTVAKSNFDRHVLIHSDHRLNTNHVIKKHPHFISLISQKIYQCTNCPYKTVFKSSFNRHVDVHSGVDSSICTHCNMEFKSKRNGMSIRRASEICGVPFTTLKRYHNKTKSLSSLADQRLEPNYSVNRILTSEQEESLKEYVIYCESLFYGLTVKECRQIAFQCAEINNLKMPKSWEENQMAGKDWIIAFRRRHDMILRKPEPCSLSRNTTFNRLNVEKFYDSLEDLMNENSAFANGTRIFNLDEISTTAVHKLQMYSLKGKKGVANLTNAEKSTLVTTCCMVSASGNALPPVMKYWEKGLGVGDRAAEGELFICYKCNYTTRTKNNLYSHIDSNNCNLNSADRSVTKRNRSNTYVCTQCDEAFSEKMHLNDHIINMHVELTSSITCKIYECTICDYKTVSNRRFVQHMSSLHPKRKVNIKLCACVYCNATFKSRRTLDSHILKTHPNFVSSRHTETEEESFICYICKYTTRSKKSLISHISSRNCNLDTKSSQFICTKCNKTFRTKTGLNDHIIKMHSDLIASLSCKIYECTICCHRTASKDNFERHLLVHHTSISNFKFNNCKLCNITYKSKQGLDDHIVQKHPNYTAPVTSKIHTCAECGYKTTKKNKLDQHTISTHSCAITSPKLSTCTHCNKSFKRSSTLDNHILKNHPNDIASVTHKVHDCSQCDYRTTKKSALETHVISRHPTSFQVYQCAYCTHNTTKLLQFRKHMRVHLRTKAEGQLCTCNTYNCTTHSTNNLQNHVAARNCNLEIDVKTSLPGNENVCSQCNTAFISKISLDNHVIKRHSKQTPTRSKKLYACSICNYKTVRRNNFDRHKLVHSTDRDIFSCNHCNAAYTSKQTLNNHIIRKHLNHITSVTHKIHECSECSYKTVKRNHLNKHVMSAHTDAAPTSSSTFNKRNLDDHIVRNHPHYVSSVTRKVHKCSECAYKTVIKGHIDSHTLSVHAADSARRRCDHCNATLSDTKALGNHILKKHPDYISPITRKIDELPTGSEEVDTKDEAGNTGSIEHELTDPHHNVNYNRIGFEEVRMKVESNSSTSAVDVEDGKEYDTAYAHLIGESGIKVETDVADYVANDMLKRIKDEPDTEQWDRLNQGVDVAELVELEEQGVVAVKVEYRVESIEPTEEADIKPEHLADDNYNDLKRKYQKKGLGSRRRKAEGALFICYNCNYTSHNKKSLSSHVAASNCNLNVARKIALASNKHTCTQCSKVFGGKRSLGNHVIKVHPHLIPTLTCKLYECEICEYKNTHKNNYDHHMLVHLGPFSSRKIHTCSFCSATYKTKEFLNDHVLNMHPNCISSIRSGIHSCSECAFKTTNKIVLHRHMFKNHPVEADKCKIGRTCLHCNARFRDKATLDDHILKKHQEDMSSVTSKIHECSECTYKTTKKGKLHGHVMAIHRGEESTPKRKRRKASTDEPPFYTCAHCDTIIKKKQALDDHITRKHPEFISSVTRQIYQCESCEYKTIYKGDMTRHISVHPGAVSNFKLSKCEHCTASFKTKRALSDHVLKNHPNFIGSVKQKIHDCPGCTYRTVQKCDMDRHLLTHSDVVCTVQLIRCSHCSSTFKTQKGLDEHTTKKHQIFSESSTHQIYQCPNCTYRTIQKPELDKHMLVHLRLRRCIHCDATFKMRRTLENHIIREHPDFIGSVTGKIHECPNCMYKSTKISELKRHLSVHSNADSDSELSKCFYCNAAFKLQRTLGKHIMKEHLDVIDTSGSRKIHQCPNCTYKTTKIGELYSHISEHSEIDSKFDFNACVHCNKVFKRKGMLESHMIKQHSNETPPVKSKRYECAHCAYKSTRKDRLVKHITSMHGKTSSNNASFKVNTELDGDIIKKEN
nr:unnamed protein product [Callosobruchus analis]